MGVGVLAPLAPPLSAFSLWMIFPNEGIFHDDSTVTHTMILINEMEFRKLILQIAQVSFDSCFRSPKMIYFYFEFSGFELSLLPPSQTPAHRLLTNFWEAITEDLGVELVAAAKGVLAFAVFTACFPVTISKAKYIL